ncbi:unannotated protein [freshwater metagenome]|uniref:Unannotated protein n=1 Tax=freshwater metagenome TaxID=449393 RepID=A0A6J7DQ60_9ZZZZ|nr:glycosyltransferase [Actinomycetota bacterium]
MKLGQYRFNRPHDLEIIKNPKLSVGVVIACRDGQEKLDLTLASLALQTYPKRLTKVYVIDDGSSPALVLPKLRPLNTKLIRFKNSGSKWGKTAATNEVVAKLRQDVLWFVDADMVLEPEHLAHHMKWHHEADDYAVLGWKRFVAEWDYTPESLAALLKTDGFDALHTEHWGKERWEKRLDRTKDLVEPGLEGFRNFVGATFSLKRSLWESVGGYNEIFRTAEDTELGWRLFLQGVRIVPDRQAHSWHLGMSHSDANKKNTSSHNEPTLAQFVPGFVELRKRSRQIWAVPTFEAVIDCRGATLDQIQLIINNFQASDQNQGIFRLLGPWSEIGKRYSLDDDKFLNLRQIYKWLLANPQVSFEALTSNAKLTIEEILQDFVVESTPFFFFIEGDAFPNFQYLTLYSMLMDTGNGLIGLANKQDRRAFAVFAPALSRAQKMGGGLYKNISETWGIRWFTNDEVIRIYEEKVKLSKRIKRYIKRFLLKTKLMKAK